jgi:hypothetical protein
VSFRNPLVSVLTPTVSDRKWFFDRCSLSVKAQTWGRVEHAIVYDAPSASEGFQRCLKQCLGEFVMPVSDDDWIAPHAVESLAQILTDGPHDVAFAMTVFVSPGNHRIERMGGAVMWRQSLTDRIGGFDPEYRYAADTELYGRMVRSGASVGYREEPLYFKTEWEGHGAYVHRDELEVELARLGERADVEAALNAD